MSILTYKAQSQMFPKQINPKMTLIQRAFRRLFSRGIVSQQFGIY